MEMLFSDFALVQRNILLKTIYNESKGVKNIEVISPIFQEKLIVYQNKAIDYSSFEDFFKLIEDKAIKTIGFTESSGYSYKIFSKIAKLLNISTEKLSFTFNDYDSLIECLTDGSIDVMVSFSLEIRELERDDKIGKVYFDKDEVEIITSRLTNTSVVDIGGGNYTIGTFTFLIGLSDKIEQIHSIHGKDLSQLIFHIVEHDTSFIAKEISETISYMKSTANQQPYLEGIPLTEGLKTEFGVKSNDGYLLVIFVSVIIFLIINFGFKRRIIDVYLFWIKYNHILLGVILLFVLYYSCLEVMIWAEKDLYESLKVKSPILNMHRTDLHLWVIVSNLASDNNGIFPVSTLGKLMFSVSFYTVWLGGICILLINYLKNQAIKRRRKGMKQIIFKDHIVLCGWNSSVENFISNFLENVESQINIKQRLVSVVENVEEIRFQYEKIRLLHDLHKIELIEGDIKQEKTLQQVNIINAKTVVIFSDDTSDSADEKTLLRALSISRFCRKLKVDHSKLNSGQLNYDIYNDSIYIIAEVNNEKYKEDLFSADVNEVVCSTNYGKNIISQSIVNHGLSNILDNILTFNDGNEFYTIDLSKKQNKALVGKTFDDLVELLRKVFVQLIAIKVVYLDECKNEIIDKDKVSQLVRRDGLNSNIIINPSSDIEINRKVDQDDVLVVFAESEQILRKSIKLLVKQLGGGK